MRGLRRAVSEPVPDCATRGLRRADCESVSDCATRGLRRADCELGTTDVFHTRSSNYKRVRRKTRWYNYTVVITQQIDKHDV